MLEKAHVGVTPGIDFGANGEGYPALFLCQLHRKY
jgi:aspartate/methionine/tyrosine aminotransferase